MVDLESQLIVVEKTNIEILWFGGHEQREHLCLGGWVDGRQRELSGFSLSITSLNY